jgi:hypothetical protein
MYVLFTACIGSHWGCMVLLPVVCIAKRYCPFQSRVSVFPLKNLFVVMDCLHARLLCCLQGFVHVVCGGPAFWWCLVQVSARKPPIIKDFFIPCWRQPKYLTNVPLHTHETQAGKRSATHGTVHLQYSLWVWQKLHWRNRQTSGRAAPWTQAPSPTGPSSKIKIMPTCLRTGS